jgi:segregation and condensation protein A
LEAFEGPLDLLLFLIRRAEVDVHDIPIAEIAGQYLASLEQLDRIDIDLAGEFLVMAATLMEIKSRLLQPAELRSRGPADDEDTGPAEDPRAELVRQLLEYKRHRDAADSLERRRSEWERRRPVAAAAADAELVRAAAEQLGEVELDDLGVYDLLEAFRGILESVNFDRLGDHQIVSDDTPLELHADDIVDRLRRAPADGDRPKLAFRAIFEGRSRAEMVGLFLAVLTLVRDQRVGVVNRDGEVCLDLLEATATPDAARA